MEFDVKKIEKTSIYIFGILLCMSLLASILFHSFSYSLGLILGYLINLLVFRVIQIETDTILSVGSKYSASLIMVIGLVKLALRALGFIVAIKYSNFFNIFSVFVGYFVIKLTIFYLGYRMRKE